MLASDILLPNEYLGFNLHSTWQAILRDNKDKTVPEPGVWQSPFATIQPDLHLKIRTHDVWPSWTLKSKTCHEETISTCPTPEGWLIKCTIEPVNQWLKLWFQINMTRSTVSSAVKRYYRPCETQRYRESRNKNRVRSKKSGPSANLVAEIAWEPTLAILKFALYKQRSPTRQPRYSHLVLTKHYTCLTFWRWNYFFNLSTPCI